MVVVLCVQKHLSGRIVKVRFGLSCLGGQHDNKSIAEEKFASSVSAFFLLLLFTSQKRHQLKVSNLPTNHPSLEDVSHLMLHIISIKLIGPKWTVIHLRERWVGTLKKIRCDFKLLVSDSVSYIYISNWLLCFFGFSTNTNITGQTRNERNGQLLVTWLCACYFFWCDSVTPPRPSLESSSIHRPDGGSLWDKGGIHGGCTSRN